MPTRFFRVTDREVVEKGKEKLAKLKMYNVLCAENENAVYQDRTRIPVSIKFDAKEWSSSQIFFTSQIFSL